MASVLLPVSLLAALLLSIPTLLGDFAAYQMGLFLIYGIVAQGIGFLWGKTGVLPLGQALFFGLAAYTSALILRDLPGLAAQLAAILTVAVVIGAAAFLLAALVFKGRSDSGPYFSLITLALAMIAEQLAGTATALTGGFNGLAGFGTIGGLDPFGSLYYLIAACAVVVSAGLLMLTRLPANLVACAVQDNEPRLQLLGFPTHLLKAAAFGFSAVIAAVAGILFAAHQGIVTPPSTGFALSAELVILTAVGGRLHVFGPLLGAVLFGWAASELRDTFVYWELLLALVFILVVLKAPGGLAELLENLWHKLTPQRRGTGPADVMAPPCKRPRTKRALHFDDVSLKIGVVQILNGVHFKTSSSGILCVIGPNGAGKTTVLNTITGSLGITDGAIRLGTKEIQNCAPYKALGHGIGRKLQVPSVFFSMTIAENLAIAMLAGRAPVRDYFRSAPLGWRNDSLLRVLDNDRVPLTRWLHRPVQELPQGHRQFLEFAMTVAAEPTLLLLDEPCAGLSQDETALMTELVRDFQARTGALVIIIEHDMSIVEAISDRVLVLHQGQVLAHGSYPEIKADPQVQAVYAGDTK